MSSSSGRLDYIETIRQWRERFAAPSARKTLLKLRLLPRWLTSADFRLAFTSGVSANSACFERELLDHYRLVFEKRSGVAVRAFLNAGAGAQRLLVAAVLLVERWALPSGRACAAALITSRRPRNLPS